MNSFSLIAQEAVQKKTHKQRVTERRLRIKQAFEKEDPLAVFYHTHGFLWGIGVGTAGWHMNGRWLRTINPKLSYHVNVGIGELFSPDERDYKPIYAFNGRFLEGSSTVDSKINILYPFRLGFGGSKYVGNKASNSGRFLQLHATGGLSLGVLKPYHIEIVNEEGDLQTIAYNEASTRFYYTREGLGFSTVRGRTLATFFYGWDQLSVRPGLFLETGMRYGYTRRNGYITTFNMGVRLDYYPEPITIAIGNEGQSFFFEAFISAEIGKLRFKK